MRRGVGRTREGMQRHIIGVTTIIMMRMLYAKALSTECIHYEQYGDTLVTCRYAIAATWQRFADLCHSM